MPPPGRGLPTVQETIERTMEGVIGHPVTLSGSSRTDAGVHAKAQLAHFDTSKPQIPLDGLRRAVNYRLPGDILIRSIEHAPDNFDAIRCTLSKRYQYVIWHAEDREPMLGGLVWHRWQPMNIDNMRLAADKLLGTHDFASFAKPGHGRLHTVRSLHECSITHRAPRVVFGIEGSGFLWQMVRIIVGTLVQVGVGRFTPDDIDRMLESRDRKSGGPTAPAHGLYLQWIKSRTEAPADTAEIETDDMG